MARRKEPTYCTVTALAESLGVPLSGRCLSDITNTAFLARVRIETPRPVFVPEFAWGESLL